VTRPYQSKEDSAIAVWVALETARDVGRSMAELIKDTGLTRYQVQTGLGEINRVKQLSKEQPIMVDTSGWRYVLPEFYDDLLPWTVNRLKDTLTRLHTERVRFQAAAAKWPDDVGRLIPRQIDRLIEDLSDVMEHVGPAA
jgi:hypothetical protein